MKRTESQRFPKRQRAKTFGIALRYSSGIHFCGSLERNQLSLQVMALLFRLTTTLTAWYIGTHLKRLNLSVEEFRPEKNRKVAVAVEANVVMIVDFCVMLKRRRRRHQG